MEQTVIPEGCGRIYAMADPREPNVPVYIGKTTSTLRTRLWDHYSESKKEKHKDRLVSIWIKEIRALGLTPVIFTLEICPIEKMFSRENYWIVQFRPSGKILNMNDGYGELGNRPKQPPHVREATENHLKFANEKRKRRVVNDLGVVYDSLPEASERFGMSIGRIKDNIAKGWKISGYHWRYINNQPEEVCPL